MAKSTIPVKQFADWQPEEIETTFGIQRMRNVPLLDQLTLVKATLPSAHQDTLERYRTDANWRIEGWNEDEYKFFFISPFLRLVDFSTPYFNPFTQRPMSLSYNNDSQKTEGRVEWMLARGRQIPIAPHFFLHEYKPKKRRDNDPLGQVLIAMVCAQLQNKDDKPVYGMYVNGRNWFLVVLQGNEYAVSLAYDITSDAIFDLFAVLEFVKDKMIQLYKPKP